MIKLYDVPGSPYGEKVRFALDHLGLEWEDVTVAPGDRAEVERLSGQRLVPIIDDHGTVLADSSRILDYLAERHDSSLLPTRAPEQGLAAMMEDWADEVLATATLPLAGTESLGAEDPRRERLDHACQTLDAVLHDRVYLVGDGLTYADLAVFAALSPLHPGLVEELMAPYINLREWYLSMVDFRQKSRAGSSGSYAGG